MNNISQVSSVFNLNVLLTEESADPSNLSSCINGGRNFKHAPHVSLISIQYLIFSQPQQTKLMSAFDISITGCRGLHFGDRNGLQPKICQSLPGISEALVVAGAVASKRSMRHEKRYC